MPSFFALSHCQYLSGYLADLESIGALCSEHNCKLIVDATQSFGAITIDVLKCNISVLGASCYKWALAGFGNGFMYINQKTLDTYPPKTVGFNSFISNEESAEYIPGMRSYEPGHHDHVAFHKLGFALQTIKELNQDIIHTRIVELMNYLVDQSDEAGIKLAYDFLDENRLGILVLPSKPGLLKHLQQHHVEVSERGGNVRLGLHYYNNEEDIDAFVKAISQFK